MGETVFLNNLLVAMAILAFTATCSLRYAAILQRRCYAMPLRRR